MPEIQSQDRRLTTIATAIRAQEDSFSKILPAFMHGQKDRFLQLAIEMAQKKDLAECSPVSIIAGVMKAAQCGLPLDGTHAALTPFKGTATFVPMFQGLVTAAMRNGGVQKIWSQVVYEGDEFREVLGSRPELIHVPTYGNRTIDKAIGAYACALLQGGAVVHEFMDRDQILAIKAGSKARNGPWSDRNAEPEMWRKTTVRRLSKYLIKSPDFQAVLDADEEFEVEPRDVEATQKDSPLMPPAGAKNLRDMVPPPAQPRTMDTTAQVNGHDVPMPPERWYGGVRIMIDGDPSAWIDEPLRSQNGNGRLDGHSLRQVAASTDTKIVSARTEFLDQGREMQERAGKASPFHQRLAEAMRLAAGADSYGDVDAPDVPQSRRFRDVEIFPASLPQGWPSMKAPQPIQHLTVLEAAESRGPKVRKAVADILVEAARVQAEQGIVPVLYQAMAEACRVSQGLHPAEPAVAEGSTS